MNGKNNNSHFRHDQLCELCLEQLLSSEPPARDKKPVSLGTVSRDIRELCRELGHLQAHIKLVTHLPLLYNQAKRARQK
jgi:hypothetical protein